MPRLRTRQTWSLSLAVIVRIATVLEVLLTGKALSTTKVLLTVVPLFFAEAWPMTETWTPPQGPYNLCPKARQFLPRIATFRQPGTKRFSSLCSGDDPLAVMESNRAPRISASTCSASQQPPAPWASLFGGSTTAQRHQPSRLTGTAASEERDPVIVEEPDCKQLAEGPPRCADVVKFSSLTLHLLCKAFVADQRSRITLERGSLKVLHHYQHTRQYRHGASHPPTSRPGHRVPGQKYSRLPKPFCFEVGTGPLSQEEIRSNEPSLFRNGEW